jgi:hypothetical protein
MAGALQKCFSACTGLDHLSLVIPDYESPTSCACSGVKSSVSVYVLAHPAPVSAILLTDENLTIA